MTQEELEQWQEDFDAFHARFADLFERSESREQARKYLRGLLTEAERKNSWQVAEAVGDRIPDRMQRLLYRVPWDADAARDRLQQFVIETDRGTRRALESWMRRAFSRKGRIRWG
jgi:SRSO17 transposase